MQAFLNSSSTIVPPGGLTFFIPINSAVDAMLARLSPSARASLATSLKGMQALVAYQTALGAIRTSDMRDGQVINTIARSAKVRVGQCSTRPIKPLGTNSELLDPNPYVLRSS